MRKFSINLKDSGVLVVKRLTEDPAFLVLKTR